MNDYGEMFYGTLPQDTQDMDAVLRGVGRSLRDIGRGVSYYPYDLIGAPVDLINMALTPVGLGSEEPVMGSDYLRNIARSLGLAEAPTGSGAETAARFAAGFTNPASGARAVGRASDLVTRGANVSADKLVQMITQNPEATAPQVLEAAGQMLPMSRITTYHGSPYLFREFDPARVGTGEGAQAYGVGAGYTAEVRPVAEDYARNLTTQRLARDIDTDPQVRSGINLMQTAGSGGIDNLENMLQTAYGYKPEQAKETVEKVRKAVGGYLYKGDIPDEILPKFLDWDKPFSEQTKDVQNAYKQIAAEFKEAGDPRAVLMEGNIKNNGTGSMMYQSFVNRDDIQDELKLQATQILDSKGVRGIRYLDQSSRNEGKGTSNFIPFRPEDYRIQEINDRPVEEFFPGLLDQPAQSVVEAPKFEMPSFAASRPETEGDIDQIYDFVEQQAKKAGYRVKSGASNISGSRYLTITEDLPDDDIRDIELRISDHGDRHPFSDATEGKISIDPSRGGTDLEAALYELQEKGFNLLR